MSVNVSDYFQTLDFVIFFGFMAVSLGVGVFFAFRDRRNKSTENYYFGERQMSPITVAISMSASYVSAITILGAPADVYLYGNSYAMHPLAVLIVDIIAIVYYIPIFYELKLLSVFEYLEMRFHKSLRMIASGLQITCLTIYMSMQTFIPALALHTVTPLDLRWTIALTSIICTLYTSMGGMKAVIWTDVIQSFVMIGGLLLMFILTLSMVGGFGSVVEAIERGGRNTVFRADFDPRVKNTVWSMVIGTGIPVYYSLICNQPQVQRWLSCKSVNKARIAVGISFFPLALLTVFSVMAGMAVYAYYEGCDPFTSGKVTKADQLVPYMVVNIFRDLPGISGLFVSAAFCGTLSSVSSGINAIAAMVFSDFIKVCFPAAAKNKSIWISKAITALFGILVMILAYITSMSSTNVLGISYMVLGLFAGPIASLFMMGAFMPWINFKGAIVGCCTGFLFVSWIAISSFLVPIDNSQWKPLPLSVSNCTYPNDHNVTFSTAFPLTKTTIAESLVVEEKISVLGRTLFAISPYFYGLLGVITGIVTSHIASIFTGFEKPSTKIKTLSTPLVRWRRFYPPCLRKYFKFQELEPTADDVIEKEKLASESIST